MEKIKNNKKVIVAMSGGVDSSVAAALLEREGFNVIGVFMKFWSESEDSKSENRCCSPESEKRARLVCEKLGVPFYIFNFEREFKRKVVDYFLKEFKAGLTPNPCVVCNKEIKFGLLFKKLLSLDADYIATGHYIRKSKLQIKNQKIKESYKILEAKDKIKDQSYFLWKLNQKILKRALFPIGDYEKSEVKNLAKRFSLPVVDIPESQEICFICTTISDFLKRRLGKNLGRIIDTAGKIIGRHQGLWFYTIGQRKGIELSGGPYYVLSKDTKRNLLFVTKKERDLYKKELFVKSVNWVSGKPPKMPIKIQARIRYGHKAVSAILTYYLKPNTYHLIFSRYQRAITPGQSVVFYGNKELLGGGIIWK